MKNTWIGNNGVCRTVVAGLGLMSLSALAQQTDNLENNEMLPGLPSAPGTTKSPPISVTTGIAEQFDSNVNKGGGFSITRFQAGLLAPCHLTDALVLRTSFKYGFDNYNFRSMQPQWRGPWQNINTYTAASILQWKIADQWSAYSGGFIRESGETSADFKDGLTGGGIIGVNYKCSDTLSFGGGLGVFSRLEDSISVLPLLTVDWKFAEAWHLKIGMTDLATIGYGAEIAYEINQDWVLTFGMQYHKSRFRIEGEKLPIVVFPSGKIYSSSYNGVGQEQSGTLYSEAIWHATSKIDINGYVGLAVGGNLKLETKGGAEIYSSDYHPAAILGLKAGLRF